MDELVAREMTFWERMRHNLGVLLVRFRRRLPYITWYGQELDVRITFSENPINDNDPIGGLYQGQLPEIEHKLSEIGVKFDKGQGGHGRDWEWDWSLRGPVSVKFIGRSSEPDRRK